MPDTIMEEASRCPTCREPGREMSIAPAKDHAGKVHIFACENVRCRDVGERWLVQVRPDGTIPQADKGPKAFPKMSNDMVSHGMRVVEDAVGRDLRDSSELE